MSDVIKLLPDAVANQIAAGEVIQRPASVVKELLENAIDAGSSEIRVVIKDAGKTLIQVIDNGVGISHTDAQLAFERHATSKISEAKELFSITTKGFRGEALASIAAIAHVELKTKRDQDDLGTHVMIEGSEIKNLDYCSCNNGSTFSVKNLFFNVPARRNFLKSDAVEYKHIVEEIHRVALAHPEIAIKFTNNGEDVHQLDICNFRQRVVQLFGKKYNDKLVPIEEETDIVKITGFIGKPEAARKSRGEQYLFVNHRFFKSPYFHHAISNAFEELIPDGHYPSYFINLDVDTSKIDVNIHPTKTEIKFEDERPIYQILRTSTRQAIGKHNIAPTLDFEQETGFETLGKPTKIITEPQIKVNPDYNPFNTGSGGSSRPKSNEPALKDFAPSVEFEKVRENEEQLEMEVETESPGSFDVLAIAQIDRNYILAKVNDQVIIVDQSRAHQLVIFNRLKDNQSNNEASQQLAFPETIKITAGDFEVAQEMIPLMQEVGLDVHEFGKNTLVVNGIPSGLEGINAAELIEEFIEQGKSGTEGNDIKELDKAFQWIARTSSIHHGQSLTLPEMNNLLSDLFQCETPQVLPNRKHTFVVLNAEHVDQLFSA